MSDRTDALFDAAHKVRSAIRHAGPVPQYHWRIMEQHREQWPTLWRALDELLDVVEAEVP